MAGTDLDHKAPLVAGRLEGACCQSESAMDDVLPVQLGHAQAGFPGTAEQSNQVHPARAVQQPPVVHGMLQPDNTKSLVCVAEQRDKVHVAQAVPQPLIDHGMLQPTQSH